MAKLIFVAEIPARRKVWRRPAWVARLRRDRWAQVPMASRSAASTLRTQLKREGYVALTRTVDGTVCVFARRGR